ncbi:uncharacterized protein LOC132299558 [Cornus florida]|uniref:uncharacterized protein LOC132299558 n=1 Tax=Cornus florida TaxID=4283 RepID=UPI00289A2A88|nr:uncharacterized protein LOC132299558 [Cornus florida]
MDKSWIQQPFRCSRKYVKGLRDFIQLARCHTEKANRSRCPCRKCLNLTLWPMDKVEEHLYVYAMHRGYTQWEFHGERIEPRMNNADDEEEDVGEEMVTQSQDEITKQVNNTMPGNILGLGHNMMAPPSVSTVNNVQHCRVGGYSDQRRGC